MDSKERAIWWEAYKTTKRETLLGPLREHFPLWDWVPYINHPEALHAQMMVLGRLGDWRAKVIGNWSGGQTRGFSLVWAPEPWGEEEEKLFIQTGNETWFGRTGFHVTYIEGPLSETFGHFLSTARRISAQTPETFVRIPLRGEELTPLETLKRHFPRWSWTEDALMPKYMWASWTTLVGKGEVGDLNLWVGKFHEGENYKYRLSFADACSLKNSGGYFSTSSLAEDFPPTLYAFLEAARQLAKMDIV